MRIIIQWTAFVIFILFISSCSKDHGDGKQQEMAQGYFPKTISLEYSSGETSRYEFTYDSDNRISLIDQQRSSGGGTYHLQSEFIYNNEGFLLEVITEDMLNGIGREILFTYENNIVLDIDLVSNATEYDTTVFYNEDQLIYGINGDLGNLPTSFRFDEKNNLTEMYINTTHIVLEANESEKGIFADLEPQPAINLWNGLLFFYTPYEMYFFNQKDIEKLQFGDYSYFYNNKVRDGNGNLTTFQMAFGGLQTINYTIQYEKRSL